MPFILDKNMVVGRSLVTPVALAHPLHSAKTGRRVSADTRGLDDMFSPDEGYFCSVNPIYFNIYMP